MKEIIVSKNEVGIRLTKYLKKVLNKIPDNILYKLLRKKYFELNNKKANGNEILSSGDKISIFLSDETYDKFKTNKINHIKKENKDISIKDRIIYEDENIIIFNKPSGLLSQGNTKNSVSVNSILNSYMNQDNSNDLFKPSVVNRLDRNTSGIIIFAKTYIAARSISEMIRNNKLQKHYKALINGVVKKDNQHLIHLLKKDSIKNVVDIKEYVSENNYKDGYSKVELEYKILKKYKDRTLLDINLLTGKSHQIRAQLSYIGFPIVNDNKYKKSGEYMSNGHQMLSCYKIKFGTFDNNELKYLNNKSFEIEVKQNEF